MVETYNIHNPVTTPEESKDELYQRLYEQSQTENTSRCSPLSAAAMLPECDVENLNDLYPKLWRDRINQRRVVITP